MNTLQFILSLTLLIFLSNDTHINDSNILEFKNPIEDILYHYELFDF